MVDLTPLGSIPYPEDTDAVSDTAAFVGAVAQALDTLTIIKPADETVNNSSSLQDDNHLLFPVVSGRDYVFEFHLGLSCGSAGVDAKLALSFPSGSNISWNVVGLSPASPGPDGEGQFEHLQTPTSGSSYTEVGVPSGWAGAHIHGAINAGADGNVRLRWAQLSATATDLNMNENSYLTARVVPS